MSSISIIQSSTELPLVESFYSIQGEGYHSGTPAYFIRLGGCDVRCKWCDAKNTWNANSHPLVPIEKILESVQSSKAEIVIITGGEPLIHQLDNLCLALKANGKKIFLETSGTKPISGKFDWICLSPKKVAPPINEILQKASELKIVISGEADFCWAEEISKNVSNNCKLYLQPEWSKSKNILHRIIEYVKSNQKWNISLQTHKYMDVP